MRALRVIKQQREKAPALAAQHTASHKQSGQLVGGLLSRFAGAMHTAGIRQTRMSVPQTGPMALKGCTPNRCALRTCVPLMSAQTVARSLQSLT
jgi:hypothetical protein